MNAVLKFPTPAPVPADGDEDPVAALQIAVDYDNTYSADPVLWQAFIDHAKKRGHDARIVTSRDDRFDRTVAIVAVEKLVEVIYTRGTAKDWYLERFHPDFTPDIWSDDLPITIFENSPTSPEDLAEWRKTRRDGPHVGDE